MSGYTKLFSSIVHSTIWREPNTTRLLWITMLAMADRDGIVHCTAPGLADLARISLEECREGIKCLESPDPDSLTPDHEGRRIQRVNHGYLLLNYDKYRHIMSQDDQREKSAARSQRYRDRKRARQSNMVVTDNHAASRDLTPVTPNHDIAEAEAEAKAKAKEGDNSVKTSTVCDTPSVTVTLQRDTKSKPFPLEAEDQDQNLSPSGTPIGLTRVEYARMLLEILGLPAFGNQAMVADAISAESKKSGVAEWQAFETIRDRVLIDQVDDVKIDRFYFQDAKWRNKPKEKPKPAPTLAEIHRRQLEELNA